MTATTTLPHPRTPTRVPDALRVAPDAHWMWGVLAAGATGSAAIAATAAWGAVQHPAAAAAVLAALTAWALTVAAVREIREARRAPRGLGSWRIACGATPLDLTLPDRA